MKKHFLQRDYQKTISVYGLVLLVLTVNRIIPFRTDPQSFGWSPAQTISGYSLDDQPPILIADQNRTVHAFTSEWLSLDSVVSVRRIIYNQWSLESGWTNPIDILLSPVKEARVTDAFLDNKGFIHVVFFGGDYVDADIYYSKAPLEDASNARSWSAPIVIGESAGDPENAVFAEDEQGFLYVVYSGRQYGNGVYVVNSKDGGETWSESTPIFLADSDAPYPYYIHAIKSKSGWLHIVWNVYSVEGQGRGIYYSRSDDGDKWSDPSLLAYTQDDLGTQTPTIIEYQNELLAIYNLPPKITMRRSADNGETWQDSVTMFPRHVGVNAALSAVIDSNDVLHLFFGQRIPGAGGADIHGMWHSVWANDRWTEPEAIVKGPKIRDLEGYTSFDPNFARAIVSQGNVILVTWRTDPGSKGNGVWFSYKIIDAPESPVVQLPTLFVDTVAPPEPTLVEDISIRTPLPSNLPVDDYLLDNSSVSGNIGWIFLGMVLIVILFIVSVLITAKKRYY